MKRLNRISLMTMCAAWFLFIGVTSAFAQAGQTQPNTRIKPTGQTRPSGDTTVESKLQVDPTKRFERLEALAKQQGDEIAALQKENTGLKIRLAVIEPGLVYAGQRMDKANVTISQTQSDLAKFHDEYANHAHSLNFEASEDAADLRYWFVKLRRTSTGYQDDSATRKKFVIATGTPAARTYLIESPK